jgi:hypothetical protein
MSNGKMQHTLFRSDVQTAATGAANEWMLQCLNKLMVFYMWHVQQK